MIKKLLFGLPLAVLAFLVAMVLWALLAPRNMTAPPSQLIGKPAPAVDLPALDPSLATAAHRPGQVRIVNFFASYCVPCVYEHGQLVALAQDDRVHLTGVTFNDKPEAAKGFLSRLGNPFDAVFQDPNADGAFAWGVNAIPTTFVVSASGQVLYRHDGAINPPQLADMQAWVERAVTQ